MALKIVQLKVSDLSLKANDLMIGSFDRNLASSAAGELTSLNLHSVNSAQIVQIKPQSVDYAVTLGQIEFAIFGGNINAKAVISWFSGWRATGKFMLKSANAPQLLAAFASKTNQTASREC